FATVDELERRVDAEVRRARVALGLEDVERVLLALGDPELARHGVEVDRLRVGIVDATEIDSELAVEESPEVGVAHELERLSTVVDELEVQLEREAEIVLDAVVILPRVPEAPAVDRKEGRVVVGLDSAGGLQGNYEFECLVHSVDVSIPLVEFGFPR